MLLNLVFKIDDMNFTQPTPEKWQIQEYLLVIKISEGLSNKLIQIKQSFATKFLNESAIKIRPQILILSFSLAESNETNLIHRMRTVIKMHAPFSIELNGYGSFPTHTIYVNVVAKQKILQLVKTLRQLQKWMKADKNKQPYFIVAPYITIACKLLSWQYEKAWNELRYANFSAMLMAEQLVLLKRKPGMHYTIAANFCLKAKHTLGYSQTNLFY